MSNHEEESNVVVDYGCTHHAVDAGLVSGFTTGHFIQILPVIAITAMLIQIEDDGSDNGSGHTRKRYLKRRLAGGSRKILPKIAVLSGEKGLQTIILPQTYGEE